MNLSSVLRLSALGAAMLLSASPASAADVHVMISAGFYHVYAELGPAFEKATGHHLITTRGPSMGDSPESIPTRPVARRGRRRRHPRWPRRRRAGQARSGRAPTARPSSPARRSVWWSRRVPRNPISAASTRFRKALLAAKSIAYSDSGMRHLYPDHDVRKARHCRSGRGQEPQGARPALGRACRGRRGARRGGTWLSAGQRGDQCARHDLRRHDSIRNCSLGFSFAAALTAASKEPEAAKALIRFSHLARSFAGDHKGGDCSRLQDGNRAREIPTAAFASRSPSTVPRSAWGRSGRCPATRLRRATRN